MIKYHNDMNAVAFKKFNSRELAMFFTVCSLVREKGNEVTISFEDIKKILDINFKDQKEFLQIIRSTNEKLLKVTMGMEIGKNKIIDFVLFTKFITDLEEKTITITLNEDFKYILNGLINNFTMFEIQEFNNLKSSYSKNMYRILKQYKTTGFCQLSMENFRRLLDIPENYKQSNIDQKIIQPIKKELSEPFKDLDIKKIREGRSIKYVRITFKPQKPEYEDEKIITIKGNIEEHTETALISDVLTCPYCNGQLVEIKSKTGSFYGHKDYKTNICKETFSTLEDIERIRKEVEAHRLQYKKEEKRESIKQRILDYAAKCKHVTVWPGKENEYSVEWKDAKLEYLKNFKPVQVFIVDENNVEAFLQKIKDFEEEQQLSKN